MKTKQPTEQELLENLDAFGAHADELAEPLSSEYGPKDSVEKFERPTDPGSVTEDRNA